MDLAPPGWPLATHGFEDKMLDRGAAAHADKRIFKSLFEADRRSAGVLDAPLQPRNNTIANSKPE